MRSAPLIRIAALLALLWTVAAFAEPQQDPAPAEPPVATGQDEVAAQPVVPRDTISVPDKRPLFGLLGLTIGSSEASRNVAHMSLRFAQMSDSDVLLAPGVSEFQTFSSLGGSLDVRRSGTHREFALSYVGGGIVYPQHSEWNTTFQGFGMSQVIGLRRWTITLSDQLNYGAETPYGGMTGGSMGSFGASVGLSPALAPNQSIFTTRGNRLSNTAGGEIDYKFTARSSWTAGASYGMLRFFEGVMIDSEQLNLKTGYNWQATAKDTIAIGYNYGRYGYGQTGLNLEIHGAGLMYARRVTGRHELDVFGRR